MPGSGYCVVPRGLSELTISRVNVGGAISPPYRDLRAAASSFQSGLSSPMARANAVMCDFSTSKVVGFELGGDDAFPHLAGQDTLVWTMKPHRTFA